MQTKFTMADTQVAGRLFKESVTTLENSEHTRNMITHLLLVGIYNAN